MLDVRASVTRDAATSKARRGGSIIATGIARIARAVAST
jgi:hypothetical protein